MKKKAKTSRKNAVITKAKAFLSRKKSKKKVTTRKSAVVADSLYMISSSDPAHSPGHRTMDLKKNSRSEIKGPPNTMTKADRIKRTATNRRVITGAALGKTGQITIK